MLGDTGANVLGGVLGLVIVLECSRTARNVIADRADRAERGGRARVVQRVIERSRRCAGSIGSVTHERIRLLV